MGHVTWDGLIGSEFGDPALTNMRFASISILYDTKYTFFSGGFFEGSGEVTATFGMQ
jgi:hypothetical protein